MGVVVDANFLIDLLAGDPRALRKDVELTRRDVEKYLPASVLFEVGYGFQVLQFYGEQEHFRQWLANAVILPFDARAAQVSAEVKAELRLQGLMKSNMDIMIAGAAIAGNHTLLTRDTGIRDVAPFIGLKVETY